MSIQAPRGTRDFYPAEMARLNWIVDAWRKVSVRSGFEEMDGPAFEQLELYTAKSGEEIVEQLFRMTDRGGRELALRPELTPSLARMISQRASALPLPIRWFSVPRLWRAERPQRGRLREFFQWNIDVVGSDDPIADAECIYVAIDLLRELGLTAADVVARISSRSLLAALLVGLGVPADRLDNLYTVIDKRAKVEPAKFEAMMADALAFAGSQKAREMLARINELFTCSSLDDLPAADERAAAEKSRLAEVFALLKNLGLADWCRFDLGIVRGLAYYTGVVFEVYDRAGELRAVAGGGRYDNLLEVLGGPKIPAVGFGMGDVVLGELLEEKKLLPAFARRLDYFLIDADPALFGSLLDLVAKLRRLNLSVGFSYRRAGVSRQFKQAVAAGAGRAIVIGQELSAGQVAVKNLATGRQRLISVDSLLADPRQPIGE